VDEGPRGWGKPLYEQVADAAGIREGTDVLDVACGTGEFCRVAADRGARVAGIDGDPAAVAEASALVPEGAFHVGDMQALPYPDDAYDVVTAFQALFYARSPLRALREARRVARPGGTVAMSAWGPEESCDVRAIVAALAPLLPPSRPDRPPQTPALGTPGRMERLAERAGLEPLIAADAVCHFVYPNEDALVASVLASAPGRSAAHRADQEAVRRQLIDGLAAFRDPGDAYRLANTFRFLVARA
jgi:SAM-dependent methyltransferase